MKNAVSIIFLFFLMVFFTSCDDEDTNGDNGGDVSDLVPDNEITIGDPTFRVNVEPGYNNIYRVAYTGEKLWALTSLFENGGGSSDTPQRLYELSTTTGEILQALEPDQPMWSMDYATDRLWDSQSFSFENKFLETYNEQDGTYLGQWNYSGIYDIYYYLTYDGEKYWAYTNYNCDGFNCQALVRYAEGGQVLSVFDNAGYEDLVYGNGFLWASNFQGIILKLNTELDTLESTQVTDYQKLGEVSFAGEMAMHLEYFDDNLWIIDRSNNFYNTGIK